MSPGTDVANLTAAWVSAIAIAIAMAVGLGSGKWHVGS